MTETDLLNIVLDLAKLYGWHTAHFRPAMTAQGWRTAVQGDGKGWPDLTMVKGSRLLFAELKSEKGKISPEQQLWLDKLAEIDGSEVYVWRPAHIDEIAKILAPKKREGLPLANLGGNQ